MVSIRRSGFLHANDGFFDLVRPTPPRIMSTVKVLTPRHHHFFLFFLARVNHLSLPAHDWCFLLPSRMDFYGHL